MRRSYLVSTGIALLITSSIFSQKNTENLKGLDEEILSIMNAYKAVGVSIAIVKQDKILYTKGYGYRDHEKKLPVTANTVFPIGSNTKSFTAALIGELQDQQKISLKDKPAAFIPGLRFSDDRMNTLITIEDLLTHRSGIGNADGSYILFPAQNRLELMKRFAYLQPGGEPRNSWIYSNSMIANRMLGLDGNKPYKYEMERYDIVKPDNKILPFNQDKKPTHPLSDYCGKYSGNGFGTMEIKQEGDNLFVLFPAFKFRLQYKQFNTFQLKLTEDIPQQMNPDFEFNFIIGNDGNISSLTMDLNEGITFKKDVQEKK
jgi:hypothetical protein